MSDDFNSYVKTHELVDEAYRDQEAWLEKTITSVARMGFFSSDRCIQEYADMSEFSPSFPFFLLQKLGQESSTNQYVYSLECRTPRSFLFLNREDIFMIA